MARWRGQHLPITDPVAMSNAAKRLVVPWPHVIVSSTLDLAGCIGRSLGYGSAPESDSFFIHAQHQRMIGEGSGKGRPRGFDMIHDKPDHSIADWVHQRFVEGIAVRSRGRRSGASGRSARSGRRGGGTRCGLIR